MATVNWTDPLTFEGSFTRQPGGQCSEEVTLTAWTNPEWSGNPITWSSTEGTAPANTSKEVDRAKFEAYVPFAPLTHYSEHASLCAALDQLPLVQTTVYDNVGQVGTQWNEEAVLAWQRASNWQWAQQAETHPRKQQEAYNRTEPDGSAPVTWVTYYWNVDAEGNLEKLTAVHTGRVIAEYIFTNVTYT